MSVIIRRVGDEARGAIERIYPDGIGEDTAEPESEFPTGAASLVVHHRGVSGVVEQVDESQLFALAEEADVTIALGCQIGEAKLALRA